MLLIFRSGGRGLFSDVCSVEPVCLILCSSISRLLKREYTMVIPRALFLTLGSLMMVAIGYVWFYIEQPTKTTLIIFLALFFILLSVEYLREGLEQKKHRTG